jgi:hypothetical protein
VIVIIACMTAASSTFSCIGQAEDGADIWFSSVMVQVLPPSLDVAV